MTDKDKIWLLESQLKIHLIQNRLDLSFRNTEKELERQIAELQSSVSEFVPESSIDKNAIEFVYYLLDKEIIPNIRSVKTVREYYKQYKREWDAKKI